MQLAARGRPYKMAPEIRVCRVRVNLDTQDLSGVGADVDAVAPRLAIPVAGRVAPIAPDDREARLRVGVARTQHVGEVEADAGPDVVLLEPGEARPEVGPAPSPDRDVVGQVRGGVFGGVLHRGVDLQEDDALRLKLRSRSPAPRPRTPPASWPEASPRCRR